MLLAALLTAAPVEVPGVHVEDPSDPRSRLYQRPGALMALDVRMGELGGRFALMMGPEGGVVLLRHIVLSAAVHVPVNELRGDSMRYWQAGLWTGLYSLRWRPVYGSIRVMWGGGSLCRRIAATTECSGTTGAFVSIPEAGLYVRLGQHARIGISGGYRFVVPHERRGHSVWALSGGEASVRLEVGRF